MSDIQFDTIPGDIRKPGAHFEFNTRLAVNTLPGNIQRVLIIGPMLSTGTAEPLTAVSVFSDDEAATCFGAGSLAAGMAAAAIKANSYLQLDVIGIEDGETGVNAGGAIAVQGTATKTGTLSVWIAGTQVSVNVENGDKAETIIPALVAAMQKVPELLVTGAYDVENSQLTVSCRSCGEWGNDITLKASTTATGLTLTITPMADGEMDPDEGLLMSFPVPTIAESTARQLRDIRNALPGESIDTSTDTEQSGAGSAISLLQKSINVAIWVRIA